MAGKRTFAQRTLAAWTYNSGCWTGVGTGEIEPPIVIPGIEYREQDRRPHYREQDRRPHYVSRGTD